MTSEETDIVGWISREKRRERSKKTAINWECENTKWKKFQRNRINKKNDVRHANFFVVARWSMGKKSVRATTDAPGNPATKGLPAILNFQIFFLNFFLENEIIDHFTDILTITLLIKKLSRMTLLDNHLLCFWIRLWKYYQSICKWKHFLGKISKV